MMPRQPDQIVMARDHPQRVVVVPVHGVFFAQPSIVRVQDPRSRPGGQVILNCRRHLASLLMRMLSARPTEQDAPSEPPDALPGVIFDRIASTAHDRPLSNGYEF